MLAVVDYGRGNIFGLVRALEQVGERPLVTEDPGTVLSADRVVLPGVGAFGDAMDQLRRRGLVGALTEVARRGTPFLGICVGCQVMLDSGDEFGSHAGLGLLRGKARRLPEGNRPQDSWRIPNVGWRTVAPTRPGTVVDGLTEEDMVYFAHSYAPDEPDPATLAATLHFNGRDVPVALQSGTLVGVQFHPERSGPVGLSILRRFLDLPAAG